MGSGTGNPATAVRILSLSGFGRWWRYTCDMSETDLELLARYARNQAEDAFAEIVRRRLDLVFSAALRQVRSPQLAEEVAQSVFSDLARNAAQLRPDTILSAWLYHVTHRTAIDVVRRESRRQLREQIATEMNAMNGTTDDWTQIEPLLDEAMHALDETDRAAVLLRYFENRTLREVGEKFGASEDAARKRVSRAVDRLREFFAKRGVTVGANGLAVVISANAIQAAPAGLAATISMAAALAGIGVGTSATTACTATKVIAMTALQKTIIGAALAAAVGTGIYQAHQAAKLRAKDQTLQQQQAPITGQIQQLQRERDEAASRLASLADENARLKRNPTELQKLRGQVGALRNQLQEATNAARRAPGAGEMSKALNAPAMRKSLAQARLAAYRKGYAPLVQQMKLTPDETEEFFNVVGGDSEKLQELSSSALRGEISRNAAIQAMKDVNDQLDAELQRLLGSERYTQYQEFKLNRSAQGTLDSLMKVLPGNSLREDQRQRLFQVLRDNPRGEMEAWWTIASPEDVQDYFQQQSEADRNILQQAGGFLDSEQLAALASRQNNRISEQKAALNLLRSLGSD